MWAAASVAALLWYLGCGITDVKQAGSGAGGGDVAAATTTGSETTSGPGAGGDPSGGTGTTSGVGGDPSGSTTTGGSTTSDTTTGAGGGPGTGGAGGAPPPPPPPSSGRIDTNIDVGWKFNKGDVAGADQAAFNDAAWMSLDLPHTWNALDGENGPTTTPAYYRGIGWYRKHLTVPAAMMGKKFYLQFDASAYITDVWVNGTKAGAHSGGYAAFRFDVSGSIKVGADNVIAVKVNNDQGVDNNNNLVPTSVMVDVAPLSGDFTMFGGIYRDVHLLATDPLAISPLDFGSSGVYLKTTNVSVAFADLTTTVKLSNGTGAAKTASVEVTLLDATGAMVQTFSGMQSVPANGAADAVVTGKVMSPHLWNGLSDPYVYRANVVVKDGETVTDAVQQPVGFRFYAMDPNTGFSLNGKPLALRGVCMHQDHKDKGGAFSPKDIDNDFAIVREIGANVIRFAHYQHSQYTYDKADQAGLVTWAENAFVNRINNTPAFAANTNQQITELIKQNFNHPSIFFWSLGNEVLLKPGPSPTAIMTMLAATVKALDPTRTCVYAANAGAQEDPTNWQSQSTSFNEYQGWYGGYMRDFATWADGMHQRHPTVPIGVAEYGAGASIVSHALPIMETGTDRTASVQTEEYQTAFHETFYQAIAARPYFVMTTIWNLFDFASDYRNEGLVPGLNTKGIVTYDRSVKKDSFYYYKANWSKDPFVYLVYRRFTAMPRSARDIKVYSNQAEVEVKLNGTSLGKKTAANHIFVWPTVTWAAGANVVEATAGGLTDRVTWTN
jgi:beta-galactosidase